MSESVSHAVYAALEEFISEERFVCLGARAALRRKTIVHHHYRALDPDVSAADHHQDLLTFLKGFEPSATSFSSFVATFEKPLHTNEFHFEELVWRYLQRMHEIDRADHPWSDLYDSDPASANFAFSVGSHPFFVVGLHPGASRPSRRFEKPALVFNSHLQFNAMGMKFLTLKSKIRKRERALSGSVNPSFVKYKDEARHYAGRFTEPDWKCPFTPNS
ncbi:guanitoxin biosynthesis heme-dependent pre-guanitoxin N-hydroxylase GntA [Amycolatopsis benzoatilytica]|uniref:guanitoxin biosynthesis heme-dependent pre-guanitoxin N-hydroxylase GntA n=1 Tax=Amycolatopsis benzoatilytica TaxID=346045 RepID=UPI0003698D7C|nr:guanitoxin biosynthesis heme-dependent pre-guanitoxin N-hydroxylase GntA [Amycolatopsis benzoatilytica]